MHVAHIVPALFGQDGVFGGAERYAYELCRAMALRAQVTLITFSESERRYAANGIQIVVLRNVARGLRFAGNPIGVGLLSAVRPADIIHCHQTHTLATSAGLLAGKLLRKPVFTTDLGGGGLSLYRLRNLDRYFAGHLHISSYSRSVFGHEHLPNAWVIFGGVDSERFFPAPDGPGREVLFVGRLLPHKGINYLIEAVSPATPLTIIGRPFAGHMDYFELLKRLAQRKNVRFITDADDAQLLECYRRALCIALPSVCTDVNGHTSLIPELLGQTVLEGMASGLPAVCTNVCSLPEIVTESETGFLVPPNDPATLRDRIDYLQSHPEVAQRMGAAGRQRVLSRFTWDQVVERCFSVYRAALEKK